MSCFKALLVLTKLMSWCRKEMSYKNRKWEWSKTAPLSGWQTDKEKKRETAEERGRKTMLPGFVRASISLLGNWCLGSCTLSLCSWNSIVKEGHGMQGPRGSEACRGHTRPPQGLCWYLKSRARNSRMDHREKGLLLYPSMPLYLGWWRTLAFPC